MTNFKNTRPGGGVFDSFSGGVNSRHVVREDYEKLSKIVGFDLVKMYNIT